MNKNQNHAITAELYRALCECADIFNHVYDGEQRECVSVDECGVPSYCTYEKLGGLEITEPLFSVKFYRTDTNGRETLTKYDRVVCTVDEPRCKFNEEMADAHVKCLIGTLNDLGYGHLLKETLRFKLLFDGEAE